MKLSINTTLCGIIDMKSYYRLISRTKKEYHSKVNSLFCKEASKRIMSGIREAMKNNVKCGKFCLHTPEYHNYGRYSLHWEIELTPEDIQDIVSDYILNQLGEDRIEEIQLELNDSLYEIAESCKWIR